jgi:4-hydroxy-3-polyprenylbenzoate decarboxylase
MGTRCDPEQDIDILRKNWSSRLDPLTFSDVLYNSRAVIDACIPLERRDDFPKIAQTTPEYKKVIMDKYGKIIKDIVG